MLSMTGYGRGSRVVDGREMTIELKSVNHRFLDLSFRMPRSLAYLEDSLRQFIQNRVKRGHIDVFITYRNSREDGHVVMVDRSLVAGYTEAIRQISEITGLNNNLSLLDLVNLPDVLHSEDAEEDQAALKDLALLCMRDALDELVHMREEEGKRLCADLFEKLDHVEEITERISTRAPGVVEDHRLRLTQRVEEILQSQPIDVARITLEVALYCDKVNIDEEITRMRSHVEAMRNALVNFEAMGRRLDFIVQEMNREANTIGSKASDIQLVDLVVSLKTEIEKIREQIQNLE